MAFTQEQRVAAANCVSQMFALRSWSPGDPQLEQDIIQLFDTFLMLIAGSAYQLQILPGKVTYQKGPAKAHDPKFTPGGAVQLKDNQRFPLVVNAVDTKNFPVPDTNAVSFTSSDNSVLTIQTAQNDPDPTNYPDGTQFVQAGNPGSAVVAGSDGNITGTLAVDVTTGDVASLTIEAGTVTDQPTSPPNTGPATGPNTGPNTGPATA
jgi:hypothetical protein